MSTYYVSVDDNITAGLTPAVGVKSTLADGMQASSKLAVTAVPQVTPHATATVTLAYHYAAGAAPGEVAKIHDAIVASLVSKINVIEGGKLHDALNATRVVNLFEGARISSFLVDVASAIVNERVVASTLVGIFSRYSLSMNDGASLHDAFLFYVGAVIHETSHIALSQGVKYVANVVMSQHVSIINYLYERMVFKLALNETGESHDTLTPELAYAGILDDAISIDDFVSPDDSVTVWAMNTRTNAVTEYRNWNFNSFASIGRKYIGANANGLFELNGERDGTANIVADMAGGMAQFNGSKFSGLKGVYIGMNNQGEFFLRLNAGDERTYLYQFVSNPGLMTSKVRTGKGLRSRYFQWELISTGPDFDLDTIEFVPMVSDRRV